MAAQSSTLQHVLLTQGTSVLHQREKTWTPLRGAHQKPSPQKPTVCWKWNYISKSNINVWYPLGHGKFILFRSLIFSRRVYCIIQFTEFVPFDFVIYILKERWYLKSWDQGMEGFLCSPGFDEQLVVSFSFCGGNTSDSIITDQECWLAAFKMKDYLVVEAEQ